MEALVLSTCGCASLSLQISALEIPNPLTALSPIWQNTCSMKCVAKWKGKPLWVLPMEWAATEQITVYPTPENPSGSVGLVIYQCTTNWKTLDMILPCHRYTSHPVSKHKWVRKQWSCSVALTEQFSFLTFHCNCFPLIWMLKCLTGHGPTGQMDQMAKEI